MLAGIHPACILRVLIKIGVRREKKPIGSPRAFFSLLSFSSSFSFPSAISLSLPLRLLLLHLSPFSSSSIVIGARLDRIRFPSLFTLFLSSLPLSSPFVVSRENSSSISRGSAEIREKIRSVTEVPFLGQIGKGEGRGREER